VPRFESRRTAKARNTAELSLNYRQEKAILALLREPNMDAAATSVGVTTRTLRRWMRQKEFSRRYKRERSMQLEGVLEVLQSSAVDAVQVLNSVAHCKTAPESSRVSASRALLEFNFKTTELVAIERRLAQLEELVRSRP
jgi:transposase-like protein